MGVTRESKTDLEELKPGVATVKEDFRFETVLSYKCCLPAKGVDGMDTSDRSDNIQSRLPPKRLPIG